MKRLRIPIAVLGLAIVAVLALAIWYQFFRSTAPPPVSLAQAANAAQTATSTTAATAPSAGTPATLPTAVAAVATAPASPAGANTIPASPAAASGSSSSGSFAGQWTLDGSASFVGYRVSEQLAGVGTNAAVGRTSSVQGSATITGSQVTAADVKADLTTLKSDDSRRDRALREQALQTGSYPTAQFTLTQPIALPNDPANGASFQVTARGNLTLHGVTKAVAIPLQAQLTNGHLVVVGSLAIQFADYNISPPRAPLVLAVDDHGTLELQLVFAKT